jgi:hypothetical protein
MPDATRSAKLQALLDEYAGQRKSRDDRDALATGDWKKFLGSLPRLPDDILRDIQEWMRQGLPEDRVRAFAKAAASRLFTPSHLWILLIEVDDAVRGHIEALEGAYRTAAALRDDDESLPHDSRNELTFAHVLCGLEWVIERNGARPQSVMALRRACLGEFAEVIAVLRSRTSSGSWHVEIPAGLPSLGRRR